MTPLQIAVAILSISNLLLWVVVYGLLKDMVITKVILNSSGVAKKADKAIDKIIKDIQKEAHAN